MSDRELRDELERLQTENRKLRARLAELEGLAARVTQLEKRNVELWARLERADVVRESWDRRSSSLKRELEAAQREQALVQQQLSRTVRVKKVARRPARRR